MEQRFSLGGLLLITILSCWLVWHYVFNFAFEAPSNPNYPDAFVKNITISMINESGQREYLFSSPNMVHYPQNDRTVFDAPRLKVYEPRQPSWFASANQGEALNGNTMINLLGNVVLTQAKGAHNSATTMTTSKATIYPKQRLVTTDQFVTATQPLATVNSYGMRLDLIQQTLDLLSQVNGTYVQPPQK